jgi:hypothetical protein
MVNIKNTLNLSTHNRVDPYNFNLNQSCLIPITRTAEKTNIRFDKSRGVIWQEVILFMRYSTASFTSYLFILTANQASI